MMVGFLRRALARWFLVVALTVVGTPCALAAFVIFAAHQVTAPVVNTDSFSVGIPLSNGEIVGTATATSGPTSWAITGCSVSCMTDFAISNLGVITITSTGAGTLTLGTYTLTVQATNPYGSGNNTVTVGVVNNYTGLVDNFLGLGATWGFSNYSLSRAYADGGGKFIAIHRQSDSATLQIGFDANYLSDSAALTGFGCSGSNPCFADTIYDQVGSNNATCTNVRAFIGSNGKIALSPQHGGYCTVPYSSAFATVKQQLFAVAQPNFSDTRGAGELQASVPTVITTGDVASGSSSITNLAATTGLDSSNYLYDQIALPSVIDSAGCLAGSSPNTGHTYLNGVSGATATVQSNVTPNMTSPSCSHTGDTLTFTQAVLGGFWISNGPASAFHNAYFGFGLGVHDSGGANGIADSLLVRNASWYSPTYNGGIGASAGNGMRGVMGVWDFASYDGSVFFDGVAAGNTMAGANITYSTNRELVLFADPQHTNAAQNNVFEQMVLVNQTFSGRATVATWLMSQYGISPFPHGANSLTTAAGFGVFPMLSESYPGFDSNFSYGSFTDAKGIGWSPEDGGYTWPSVGWGTHVNNSPATYFIFNVHEGDGDIGINNERRAELAALSATVAPGQDFSYFVQLRFVNYVTQYGGGSANGAWCFTMQTHYASGPSIPDLFTAACEGGQLQMTYHNGTACGAPITIVPGQVLAFQIDGRWSAGHTTDQFTVYAGVNGTSLTLLCNVSGALFSSSETSAYMKQGLYTGDYGQQPGALTLEVMNPSWSNTANAFDGYRTAQPALPTHP